MQFQHTTPETQHKVRSNVKDILDMFERNGSTPELAVLSLLQAAVLVSVFAGIRQRVLFSAMMDIYNHRSCRVKTRDD